MSHLLEVNNLQTQFPTRAGVVKAVNDVSFYINEGELLGLVGESGYRIIKKYGEVFGELSQLGD